MVSSPHKYESEPHSSLSSSRVRIALLFIQQDEKEKEKSTSARKLAHYVAFIKYLSYGFLQNNT